jgi:hypothetical protein
MALVACICAIQRDPDAELCSNTHTVQRRQQPIPQLHNLSPSRKLSSIAVTDVTAPCTNRDVMEAPAPTRMLSTFPDGMEVLNESLWTIEEAALQQSHRARFLSAHDDTQPADDSIRMMEAHSEGCSQSNHPAKVRVEPPRALSRSR